MQAASSRLAIATAVFAALLTRSAGATNTAPPLEQLGLRDALLAKPEVIAVLGTKAHQQLAQRFEDARRHPGSPQELLVATELVPLEVIRAVDQGRLTRGRDALIAGLFLLTPVGITVPFYSDEVGEAAAALPALEGVPAGATAENEASALRGVAGAVLQGLLAQSQATRLVRVVSWPVAAVAIQDAVYVNAAWLIAMGPDSAGNPAAPTKSAGSPSEAGCGGSVIESSQGSLPTNGAPVFESASAEDEPVRAAASASPRTDAPPQSDDRARHQIDTPQYLWSGGSSGSTASAATSTGLPIASLVYALDSAATSSTDCCRYTSDNGCDTSTPCQSGSSSCSSGSGSGCSSGSGSSCGSGSGSGCSSGSGSSCGSGSGSSCGSGSGSSCGSGSGSSCGSGSGSSCSGGSGSSCGSGSGSSCSGGSGSSCGSGSGSSCSSGSGSSCGSGSGSSSSSCSGGSGCGSSGGSSSKCSLAPQRPRGEIPDAATLIFLLAPLAFLMLQERRWRQ